MAHKSLIRGGYTGSKASDDKAPIRPESPGAGSGVPDFKVKMTVNGKEVCFEHGPDAICTNCSTGKSEFVTAPMPGWECPKCGTVYAPWVKSCKCSKKDLSLKEKMHNETYTLGACTCNIWPDGHREPTTGICPVHGFSGAKS